MDQEITLSEFWLNTLGACEPVAHLLRNHFSDRWVRFHSLPDSKRYPEGEGEMSTVLIRHDTLISHLSNGNKSLVLLALGSSESIAFVPNELAERGLFSQWQPWRSVAMHELSNDWSNPTYWHISSVNVEWKPGVLDAVLRLVANDEIANLMILSLRDQWLFHPYDGGADVILPSQARRDSLKSEFSQWLSDHPLGL